MALSVSVPHQLRPINTHFGMSEGLPEDLRVNLERNLEREQSLGNRLYRTITPDWFETHKSFVDIFINDPNDPNLLEEIQQPLEGQASARMPAIQEHGMQSLQNPFAAPGDCFPNFPAIPSPSHHSESPYQLSPVSMMEESHMTPMGSATPMGAMGGAYSLPPPSSARDSGLLMPHVGSSPAITPVETPNKSPTNPPAGLRSIRTSSRAPSRPDSAPLPSTSGESRRWSGEMPGLISLADKAASLGAPHKILAAKQGAHPQNTTSVDLSQDFSRSSDGAEGGAAEGLSINQDAPKKRGPGRRKRTEPVWVETEEGEKKLVSPTEYRMLRRRITNRMSARRMRAKHADEKEKIQETHADLQKQLSRQAARMQEFVAQNEQLREALQKCVDERDYYRNECAKREQYIQAQQMEQQNVQMRGSYPEEAYMRLGLAGPSLQQHSPQAVQAGSPLVEGRSYHSREPSFGATLEAAQRINRAQPPQEDPYGFPPLQMERHTMQSQMAAEGSIPPHAMFGGLQQEQMDFQMQAATEPPDLFHPPNRM